MENNKKNKYIESTVSLLLVVLFLVACFFAYKIIVLDKVSNTESNVAPITIKEDKYKSVTSPQNYGTPVSTSAEGFGRTDPFEPF